MTFLFRCSRLASRAACLCFLRRGIVPATCVFPPQKTVVRLRKREQLSTGAGFVNHLVFEWGPLGLCNKSFCLSTQGAAHGLQSVGVRTLRAADFASASSEGQRVEGSRRCACGRLKDQDEATCDFVGEGKCRTEKIAAETLKASRGQ